MPSNTVGASEWVHFASQIIPLYNGLNSGQLRTVSMSKSEAGNNLKKRSQGMIALLEMLQKWLTAFFIFTLPIIFYVLNTDMSYPKVIYSFGMISLLLFLWGIQSWLKGEFRVHLPILFWPSLRFWLYPATWAI